VVKGATEAFFLVLIMYKFVIIKCDVIFLMIDFLIIDCFND
jgi:hypothetical protein